MTNRTWRCCARLTTAALVSLSILVAVPLLAGPPYKRLDVGGLSPSSSVITSYNKAVKAMKALPPTNPLSWTYQAAIHGTTVSGSHPAWNTCEHGTYFFFSWHRMYLWYFERIVRKMSGDPNWALPYWNYEKVTERHLPDAFRVPANATNDLYTSSRGTGWNAGTASFLPSTVDTAAAFLNVPFNAFSSSLEGTPHGAVHVAIGGWMGSVPTAAQDPIFWLHHSNIDRLWNLWLAQGGGRTDPLNDATWKSTKFTFFDENGKQVQLTGCDILRALEQLDYSYEGEPAQVKLYCTKRVRVPAWLREVLFKIPVPPILGPGPDPAPYEIDIRELRQRLTGLAAAKDTDLLLEFDGVEADRQPDVYYEVYVGQPKGEPLDSTSPRYVGNIALFGHGVHDEHQHGGFKPASFSFKINRAVAAALKAAPRADSLSVLFVPRSSAQNDKAVEVRSSAKIQIGSAAISVRRLEKGEK